MKKILHIQVLLLLMLFCMTRQALPQALSLSYPNGGEVLHAATIVNIEWNYINVDNILIEYSIDGGFHWHTIIPSLPSSALSYAWKVPPTPSEECLVRITDLLGGAQDESDAFFTIPVPTIQMTYPNEPGIVLYTNTIEGLEWETPDVDDVKLEYSLDNGVSWVIITESMDGFWRYRNWVVPSETTTQGLFRIISVFNNDIYHVTEHNFSIEPLPVSTPAKYRGGTYDGFAKRSNLEDFITLTHPVGGEVWTTNSTRRITWDFENVEDISIDISYDGGETWSNIIPSYPASAKGYNWVVAGQTSTECKIRVRDIRTGVEDISPEVFTIPPPQLTITYPQDGDVLMAQTIESIEWIGDDITNVTIHYSLNGGETWTAITNSVPGIWNYFNWVVPTVEVENVLLRITDVDNASNVDELELGFHIIPLTPSSPAKYRGGSYDGYATRSNIADSLQLLSPNGGEIFLSSQTYPIEWAYTNVDNIRIEFSYDNGNTWSEVIASVPASALKYNWTVPSQPSQYCKIRITCLDNPEISDESDLMFTIPYPTVNVVYPLPGVQIQAGTIEAIEWESLASESVRIEFSDDNGETWQMIADNVNGHWGYYNWVVPQTLSNQCLIRITDNQDDAFFAQMHNVFSIVPLPEKTPAKFRGGSYDGYAFSIFLDQHLLVRKPNGWEAYLTNEVIPLRWTHLNIEGTMRIDYTSNNEQSWHTIVSGISVDDNLYLWDAVREPSPWYKIRVVHESGLWEDKSDNFFIIGNTGNLQTLPLADGGYCAGQLINISFTTSETFGPENMFIAQLSDANGSFYENTDSLGVLYATASGVIQAEIPEHVTGSGNYRIRVVSTDPPYIGTDNGADISINALPEVNLGNDTIICAPNTLTLHGGEGASAYLWSTQETTPQIVVSSSGTYRVHVTNGCGTVTDSITVHFRELPSNPLPAEITICSGSPVVLNANHPEAVSYAWSTGQVTPAITITSAGAYTVTLGNACGTADYTVDVVSVPHPVVDIGEDITVCGEEEIVLQGPSGFSAYSWNTGSTNSSIVVSETGFYNLTVTDTNGCSGTGQIYVQKHQISEVSLGEDVTLCFGEPWELAPEGTFVSYNWSTGESGASITPNLPETYWVEATDLNGCVSSDTITLEAFPYVLPDLGSHHHICEGEELLLDVGFGYVEHSWCNGDTSHFIMVSEEGDYKITVTDDYGCVFTDSVYVSVHLPPDLQMPDDIVVPSGEEVTLSAIYSHGIITWDQGIINGEPFVPAATGIYTATVTSSYGCGEKTGTVWVIVEGDEPQQAVLTIENFGEGRTEVDGNKYTLPVVLPIMSVAYLDAFADVGWLFIDWLGDLESGQSSESIVMDADKSITARFGQLGDVNLDGNINIMDVTILVAHILEKNPPVFYLMLADVNQDTFVNIGDVVGIVNIILFGTPVFPGKTFESTPAFIAWHDGQIWLESDGTLAALQFEYLAKDAESIGLELLQDNLQIVWNSYGDRVKGMVFSMDNTPIPQGFIPLIQSANDHEFVRWGKNLASNPSGEMVEVNEWVQTHAGGDVGGEAFGVSIYPNPSTGIFFVQMETFRDMELEMGLCDATGRLIMKPGRIRTTAGSNTYEMGSNDLPMGFYLLMIEAFDATGNKPLIRKQIKIMIE